MNVRRRPIVAAGVSLLALALAERARSQPAKFARIGWLHAFSIDNPIHIRAIAQVREGMLDYGYVEGKHFEFVRRFAGGDNRRFPELAAELVGLKVDIILTTGTPATLAAKRATTTIPIVFYLVGDAVRSGVVASLANSGANVTGGTFFLSELCAKRLQLIKETIPALTQVAVLVNPDNMAAFRPNLDAIASAAGLLGVSLHRFDAGRTEDLGDAFQKMAQMHVGALVLIDDTFMNSSAGAIADQTAKHRIPSIGFTETVEAGGLMAYGVDRPAATRRAAYFLDKVLKGAKPADIPVEQPTRFDFAINMKTAKALGIRIPSTVLLRVDKLIE